MLVRNTGSVPNPCPGAGGSVASRMGLGPPGIGGAGRAGRKVARSQRIRQGGSPERRPAGRLRRGGRRLPASGSCPRREPKRELDMVRALSLLAGAVVAAAIVVRCASPREGRLPETVTVPGGVRFGVETVIGGLDTVWDMIRAPDGSIWFSERAGRVSRLDPASGTLTPRGRGARRPRERRGRAHGHRPSSRLPGRADALRRALPRDGRRHREPARPDALRERLARPAGCAPRRARRPAEPQRLTDRVRAGRTALHDDGGTRATGPPRRTRVR